MLKVVVAWFGHFGDNEGKYRDGTTTGPADSEISRIWIYQISGSTIKQTRANNTAQMKNGTLKKNQ